MEILTYSQQMIRLAFEGRTQGILFWVSIYVFVAGLYSLWFQIRTRNWPSAKGKLTQVQVKKFGAIEWATTDQEYIGKALYTYLVSGKQYEGSRISPWIFVVSHNARWLLDRQLGKIQKYPDGQIRVYYNPGKPQKSYLIAAGKYGIVFTILLGSSPFLLYLMKYHA